MKPANARTHTSATKGRRKLRQWWQAGVRRTTDFKLRLWRSWYLGSANICMFVWLCAGVWRSTNWSDWSCMVCTQLSYIIWISYCATDLFRDIHLTTWKGVKCVNYERTQSILPWLATILTFCRWARFERLYMNDNFPYVYNI